MPDSTKVPTSLYTTEAALSREKVEKELKVPDPPDETAASLLNWEEDEESVE